MIKNLINKKTIGIDTNIFIYYFDSTSQFHQLAKDFFSSTITQQTQFVINTVSLTELLSFQAEESTIEKLLDSLLQLPKLKIFDINKTIAIEAARIRRKYGYGLSDSMHLATALFGEADIFITNDKSLQNFKEIKIRLLSN